jgi:hypothetical protein
MDEASSSGSTLVHSIAYSSTKRQANAKLLGESGSVSF